MDQIDFNAGSLILILIVFQGMTYAVFLLTRAQPQPLPSRLLGIFTAVFSLHFANVLLVEFGPLPDSPNFNPVFAFCYGPLLLIFVRSLVLSNFSLCQQLTHLWAPLVAIPLVWLSSSYWPSGLTLISVVLLGHLLGYVLQARRELRRFKQALQAQYSAIDQVNLDWLSRLLNQVLFLAVITSMHLLIQMAGYQRLQSALTLLIFASVLYFINALVLKGMSHPSLAVWLNQVGSRSPSRLAEGEARPPDQQAETEDARYLGSGLGPEESERLFQRLQQLMRLSEPYLEENLSLQQLADKLSVSPKHLSQVINQNAGQSFYDYINGYRIAKAQALLTDPRHAQLRISQIMYKVGYSAKSTFNSLFRQYSGMTPTEYRRKKSPRS